MFFNFKFLTEYRWLKYFCDIIRIKHSHFTDAPIASVCMKYLYLLYSLYWKAVRWNVGVNSVLPALPARLLLLTRFGGTSVKLRYFKCASSFYSIWNK